MIIFASDIFNLSNILAFILGMVAGMAILFSVVLIIISRGKKEVKKVYAPSMEELSKEKVRELIKNKQKDFIFEVEENDADYFKTVMSLTMELLHEISSYYYPDSKYPEYELTVNEAIELVRYIVDQINLVFEKPVIKHFKNKKISSIVSDIELGRKASKSKAMEAASKSSEAFGASRAILNTLNPVYWFRKVVVKGTVNKAIKELCKAELTIAGREFNKVYSKDLFKESSSSSSEETQKTINEDIEEIFNDEV